MTRKSQNVQQADPKTKQKPEKINKVREAFLFVFHHKTNDIRYKKVYKRHAHPTYY